jgi:tyrosine decarboxylase/aspartate 1-decarboxylase
MYWPKLTNEKIKQKVVHALSKNANYRTTAILGVPATYLDPEIFYDDAPFLENAPFLSTLISNPNHIGCHTLENPGEKLFKGTQEIENELIKICAEEIFQGEKNGQDGYIASGGTEANIEALWIYRNYFMVNHKAKPENIGVIYSQDSHYSIAKGINILNIKSIQIEVDYNTREILIADLKNKITIAQQNGIDFFIVILNMSTTMFGSVDDIENITSLLNTENITYKLHIDAAFGGFIYPFTNTNNKYTFKNPNITSFTIDAHKMLQTPYGTGIFLIRKNYMNYVKTEEAQYVMGTDHTLCGSRSGANAIAVWMVLHTYGYNGWKAKMQILIDRTTDICAQLDAIGVKYYRNPYLNIIAIHASEITKTIADKYLLVADSYENKTLWWKIVVMPHITRGIIDAFINDIKSEKLIKS